MKTMKARKQATGQGYPVDFSASLAKATMTAAKWLLNFTEGIRKMMFYLPLSFIDTSRP